MTTHRSWFRPLTSTAPTAGRTRPARCGSSWTASGSVTVNGEQHDFERMGAHRVIRHERHEPGELSVVPGPGVRVLMTGFLPGLAPA